MIVYFNYGGNDSTDTNELGAMEYMNEITDKGCEIVLVFDEDEQQYIFTYGDSGAGFVLLGHPDEFTFDEAKAIFETVCKKVTSDENFTRFSAINPHTLEFC